MQRLSIVRRGKSVSRLLVIGLFIFAGLQTLYLQVRPASAQVNDSGARAQAAYTVNGVVFDDYNQNGTQDTREPGINGIVVTAYDSAGKQVATATTATEAAILGSYSLTIPAGTGPVRVQFSNFGPSSGDAQLTEFYPSNHVGGTSVAFVSGDQLANTINLGLERPAEYCQNNPQLATSCYLRGDQTSGKPVVVKFPYANSGDTPDPEALATDTQVGATWGLAYRRSSDSLFAAAYLKRHSGFKPDGSTGAIYIVDHADTANPGVNLFVDLNALFGSNVAGDNAHDTSDYTVDSTAYDQIGKISLGGLALSDDEATLYALNLADRKLYIIPVGAAPDAPVAPTSSSQVSAIAVPQPADCTDSALDFRPFAVTVYNGRVYVGAVCSAESTVTLERPLGDASKLQAYVFVYTPGVGFATQPVIQFPLNYTRHCANDGYYADCTAAGVANLTVGNPAAWNPWHPGFISYQDLGHNANQKAIVYPQPMLTGITFDNGDMILGIRDRYGDQMGVDAPAPNPIPSSRPRAPQKLYNGVTAGDTLRACLNVPGDLTSGWTLESNASCGGIQTAGKNTGQGPGTGTYNDSPDNGEYYYQDNFGSIHDEVSLGGVYQIPGFPDVVATMFDPTTNANSGGVRKLNNTTGATSSGYQVYVNTVNTGAFSKSNGLGSVVAFCQSAPVEIGNRVWFDANGNGLQDANEPPIPGVTVHLYSADGTTLLQTAITDANGAYYFTISPYTHYVLKLDNPADYSTGPLGGLLLTAANRDTQMHEIDSKATLSTPANVPGPDNYPEISVDPHGPGENDQALDAGFATPPDLVISKQHQGGNSFQVGQTVSYTLTVSNTNDGGPVTAGNAITVVDTLPTGFGHAHAQGSGWTFVQTASTITATYTGPYPVAAGAVLPVITVTGTLTAAAVPSLSNTATVATPGDSNKTNNTSTNTVDVSPGLPPTGSDPTG